MTDATTPAKRPNGRPVGSGPVARLRRELLTDGKLDALVLKTYELAMAGDVAAIRILLDRVVPALRSQAALVSIALPTGSLTDQAKALLRAVADGGISSDQGAELIAAIGRVVQVEQGDELRRRLDAIEHGDLA